MSLNFSALTSCTPGPDVTAAPTVLAGGGPAARSIAFSSSLGTTRTSGAGYEANDRVASPGKWAGLGRAAALRGAGALNGLLAAVFAFRGLFTRVDAACSRMNFMMFSGLAGAGAGQDGVYASRGLASGDFSRDTYSPAPSWPTSSPSRTTNFPRTIVETGQPFTLMPSYGV